MNPEQPIYDLKKAESNFAEGFSVESIASLLPKYKELRERLLSMKKGAESHAIESIGANFRYGSDGTIELIKKLTAEIQDTENKIYDMTGMRMSEIEERERTMDKEMGEREAKTQEPK